MHNPSNPIHVEFLIRLFSEFNSQNIDYCLSRNYQSLPNEISDDIDILVRESQVPNVDSIIRELAVAPLFLVKQLKRNYHLQYYISSVDEIAKAIDENRAAEIVELDIVTALQWRGIPYLDTKSVLSARRSFNDFFVPDAADFLGHVFFHAILDKGHFKGEYWEILRSGIGRRDEGLHETLGKVLGTDLADKIYRAIDEDHPQDALRQRNAIITKMIANPAGMFLLVGFTLTKYLRIATAIVSPPGILITALGPDGSGKTTLLTKIGVVLGNCYDPISDIYMGWKNFILPTKRLLRTLQRLISFENQGGPREAGVNELVHKPSWTHNISVAHYVLDLWARYLIQIRPILARGGLVLCDRYFFDFVTQNVWLSDNRLSRSLLVRLCPTPSLTIIFSGDAAIVSARKKENSAEATAKQMTQFQALHCVVSPILELDATAVMEKGVFSAVCKLFGLEKSGTAS
jgi:thymidylate kinase